MGSGMKGEISRFEDCEGCTDVKIEGDGTVEDEHGWGIRAPFWGAFLLHRLSKVPSTIVAPHTIVVKTFPPNGYIWIWSELVQIVKALFSIKEWQNFQVVACSDPGEQHQQHVLKR